MSTRQKALIYKHSLQALTYNQSHTKFETNRLKRLVPNKEIESATANE